MVVGTQGLLLCAVIWAANVKDRNASVLLMGVLFGLFPFLLKLYVDPGYRGPKFQHALRRVYR